MRTCASWPSALRGVLLYRGQRWRTELAAVEHGVIALLALLEAHRGREHVSSALGLLDLVHPPIRDLTRMTGIRRAGSVGSVDDRHALHLVAIILRIRPGDTDGRTSAARNPEEKPAIDFSGRRSSGRRSRILPCRCRS